MRLFLKKELRKKYEESAASERKKRTEATPADGLRREDENHRGTEKKNARLVGVMQRCSVVESAFVH